MFQVTVNAKGGMGLLLGLVAPIKYQSRLGIVKLFRMLEQSIISQDKDKELPEKYTIWPVSVIMPCRKSHVYKGPDDFPLENIGCECKSPKHRPVAWAKTPSYHFKFIKNI